MGNPNHQRTHNASQPPLLDSPKNNSQKSDLGFENLEIDIDNNILSYNNDIRN